MNQTEIEEAIAEQEEHIKRQASCCGVLGLPHQFHNFVEPNKNRQRNDYYLACVRCSVTQSAKDFRVKIAAQALDV